MGFNIEDLLGGSIIKEAGDAIDKITTSDEERMALENKAKQLEYQYSLEADRQVTQRWKWDMEFGNVLSKSVRPATFAWWTMLITLIIVFDGNLGWYIDGEWYGFNVNKEYIPFIFQVYQIYTTAYIAGRTIEKIKGAANG